MDNSGNNYKQQGRHGILFIADSVDNDYLLGRLVKIRVGRVRRINIPDHKEWYETVKNENGIEQEAHAIISPLDEIMLTEYNSEAFGILPRYIFDYFRETMNCPSREMLFSKLTLPKAFEELVSSKALNIFKFSVQGDLTQLMEDLGFTPSKIIMGNHQEIPVSLSLSAKYEKRSIMTREGLEKLIGLFKRGNMHTKNAAIETEKGYFSLISATLLNEEIFYDSEIENSDSEAFKELRRAYQLKCEVAKEALEIIEKESLDYYGED